MHRFTVAILLLVAPHGAFALPGALVARWGFGSRGSLESLVGVTGRDWGWTVG